MSVNLFQKPLFAAAIMALSGIAVASPTPGNHIWFSFPSTVTAITDLTYHVTVNQDPGPLANVFWSNQFQFMPDASGHSHTGYFGMQSNGGSTRTFLASVWGATAYKAGDSGSYCLNGTEGTAFVSCRMKTLYWKQGHTYAFHMVSEGNQWFGFTVTDNLTNQSYKLGSIQVGSDALNPRGNTTSWTEYFEWNAANASCTDQPYAKATFGFPVVLMNGKQVLGAVSGADTGSSCQTVSKNTTNATTATVTTETAIPNSLRGAITTASGQCLINNGGVSSLGACNSFDAKQGWVVGSNGALQNNHLCLTNSAGLPVTSCSSPTTQLWTYQNGQLQQQGTNFCLTASNSTVTTQLCNSNLSSQQWVIPAFPGVTHQIVSVPTPATATSTVTPTVSTPTVSTTTTSTPVQAIPAHHSAATPVQTTTPAQATTSVPNDGLAQLLQAFMRAFSRWWS